MNNQLIIIYSLLERLEKKYFSDETIRLAIIEKNISKQNKLEFVESLCQTVITSLNFGNYKRATKYLVLADAFCEKFLSAKS